MSRNRRCGLLAHLFALGVVVLGLTAGARWARADAAKDAAIEKQIEDEITAQSAEAGRVFAEATSARDRGDASAAKRGYKRVTELLPTSDHAFRRLCGY